MSSAFDLNGAADQIPYELLVNTVELQRQALARYIAGGASPEGIDIDAECRYPDMTSLTAQSYREMFDRFGVAQRVVGLFPDEMWGLYPQVYEEESEDTTTAFEEGIKELNRELMDGSTFEDDQASPIWEALHRLDFMAGIGRFGVMLLGLGIGNSLADPVPGFEDETTGRRNGRMVRQAQQYVYNEEARGGKRVPLLYLRVFDESLVTINRWENNRFNRRYGQPLEYNITLSDPNVLQTGVGSDSGQTAKVHWSRVVHVCDNMLSSEVLGIPRMQSVYPHLLDLRKLYGGSAEMYWQGAFPGISFETHPQLGNAISMDGAAMKQQVQDYFNGLQRWLAMVGASAKTLSPTVVDPTSQINAQLEAICIKLGVPMRIFMGSERGELASSQDADTWESRLQDRRIRYATPRIIKPFFDRLIAVGVLPKPKQYKVKWNNERDPSPMERADLATKRTQVMGAYVGGGLDVLITPLDFLVKELGYDRDEAEEMLEDAEELQVELEEEKAAEQEELLKQQQEAGVVPAVPGQPQPPGAPVKPPAQAGQPQPPKGKAPFPVANADSEYDGTYETDPVELVDNNCGIGSTGFLPGNTCAKGGGGGGTSFPGSPSDLKSVSALGGSTGAMLKQDANGNKFVVKKGANPGHVKSEDQADNLYRKMGVLVPDSKLYNEGGSPTKVSAYLEGGKMLNQYDLNDPKVQEQVVKVLQQDFALDATMGNWDVVGANMDNIMVVEDEDGNLTPYRIDNGGALAYRAQGALKGAAWNNENKELETMRNDPKNPGAKAIYGSMTDKEVIASIDRMVEQWDKAKFDIYTKDIISEDDYDRIEARVEAAKEYAKSLMSQTSTTTVGVGPEAYTKMPTSAVLQSIKENGTPSMNKQLYQEKLAFLNPAGVQNGVYFVPFVSGKLFENDPEHHANIEVLKDVLPPGTKIQGVWVKKSMKTGEFDAITKEAKQHIESSKAAMIKALASSGTYTPAKESSPYAEKIKAAYAQLEKDAQAKHSAVSVKDVLPATKTIEPPKVIEGNGVEVGTKVKLAPYEAPEKKLADQTYDQFKSTLKSNELAAIAAWKGSAKEFRERQNAGKITDSDVALRSALKKAPDFAGVTYRGVARDFAEQQGELFRTEGVGYLWGENVPMCTSRNVETGLHFSQAYDKSIKSEGYDGRLLMKFSMKNGAAVDKVAGFWDEQEIMGRPGEYYRVKRIVRDAIVNGKKIKTYVELEQET